MLCVRSFCLSSYHPRSMPSTPVLCPSFIRYHCCWALFLVARSARELPGDGSSYSSKSDILVLPSRVRTDRHSSVPPAVLTAIVVTFSLPNGFPYHALPINERPNSGRSFSRESLQRLDYVGTVLLLMSTVLLVAVLEEAGLDYPWKSAFVITLFTISGIGWAMFLVWERQVTYRQGVQEPIFPWRFVQSRVWVGMML